MTFSGQLSQNPSRGKMVARCLVAVWAAIPVATGVYRLSAGPDDIAQTFAAVWLAILYGYWVVATFHVLILHVGRIVLRQLGDPTVGLDRLSTALFEWCAGLYVGYWVLLFLGLLGRINPVTMGIAFCVASSVFLWNIRSNHDADAPRGAPTPLPLPAYRTLLAVLAGLWLLPYFLQTLLPNADFDGAMYHLPLAKRFIAHGLWSVDPNFEQFNSAGAVHLVYALFMTTGAREAIIPFNFSIVLGILLTVYAMTNRFWGRTAAGLATAVCAAVNVLMEVGLDPRVDAHLALYCLLGVYAFLLWAGPPSNRGMLPLAGLALGLAMGVKFTAVFFVLALGAPILYLAWRRARTDTGVWRAVALSLALLSLPSALWYARNARELRDPIHPFLNGAVYRTDTGAIARLKPAVAELSEQSPPPPEFHEQFEHPPSPYLTHHLFNWWQMLRHPELYARKPLHWLSPFLLLFFVLPLAARDPTARWIYGIALTVYLLTAAQTNLIRYAAPVLPLFAAGTGIVLSKMRGPLWRPTVVVLLAANLAYTGGAECLKLARLQPRPWWSGAESELQWLEHAGYNGDTEVPRFIAYLNGQVARGVVTPQDMIFMVGEAKGDLLPCAYLPDCSRNAERWLAELVRANGDLAQLDQSLSQQGVRYVLVNEEYFWWDARYTTLKSRFGLDLALWKLEQFTGQYGELVWNEVPTLKLYRLKAPPRAS